MNAQQAKPGAIAKMLGVSGMTVRNYVKAFREFLSPSATGETNRTFTAEDVKVLRLATSLLREGFTYDETRQQLKERLPLEGEVFEQPFQQEQPLEPPSAIQPLEFFTQFMDTLRQEHQEHVSTLKAENERLRLEIQQLKKPWWKRLF